VSVLSDSRPSSDLPAVLPLRPYQQRWIDDGARFKGAVKSARIGFSFATAGEAVLDCLEHPGTTWTIGSHSASGSQEFVEEGAGKIIKAINATAEIYDEPFADDLGATDIQVKKIRFPNGARILALPANPRTMRGFPGNVVLDEFGHHEGSYAIWAAASRQVALGHKLRMLSTPNGEQGKFYDLAREFGLDQGVAPETNPVGVGPWSWHWVDIHMAIAQGCPVNLEEMRALYKGDDETFAQEFLCVFIKSVGAWLSLELISRAEDIGATLDWPSGYLPAGRLCAGLDVGRDGDRSVFWLDEEIGDVAWTRMVMRLHNVPFFTPDGEFSRNDQAHTFLPWVQLADRTAMDSTGIGLGLFEWLAARCPGRVLGLNFSGSIPKGENVPAAYQSTSGNVKIKTDLAVRLKQRLEQGRCRIPHDSQIRQELQSIKKEYSGGAVKFDAPRIEIDTAVAGGKKKKVYAHADSFWAKAMAEFAAAGSPDVALGSVDPEEKWYRQERRSAFHPSLGNTEGVTRERRSIFDRELGMRG
jgi:phage FluMu gp28-like protein